MSESPKSSLIFREIPSRRNALLAFGVFELCFHQRVSGWVSRLETTGVPELATCSITELGFIRVLAQSSEYGLDIRGARHLLLRLKTGSIPKFTFVVDDLDISQLQSWVCTGARRPMVVCCNWPMPTAFFSPRSMKKFPERS